MSSLNLDLPGSVDDDTYERTLRALRARAQAFTDALAGAALCHETGARVAALGELHTWLRGMAAVANHALGDRPDGEPQ